MRRAAAAYTAVRCWCCVLKQLLLLERPHTLLQLGGTTAGLGLLASQLLLQSLRGDLLLLLLLGWWCRGAAPADPWVELPLGVKDCLACGGVKVIKSAPCTRHLTAFGSWTCNLLVTG
jgi:hypothetical protein